jgi:hypothetical protein
MELRNLAGDPAQAKQRKILEGRLEELSKAAGPDPIPVDEGISNVPPKY